MSAPQPTPDDDVVIAPPPLPAVAAADAAAERDRLAAASEPPAESVVAAAAPPPAAPRPAVKRPAVKRPARPRKPKVTTPPRPVLPPEVAAARFEAAATSPSDADERTETAEVIPAVATDDVAMGESAEAIEVEVAPAPDVVAADADGVAAEAPEAGAPAVEGPEAEEAEQSEVEVVGVGTPAVEVAQGEAAEVDVPEADASEEGAPEVATTEVHAHEADILQAETGEVDAVDAQEAVEIDVPPLAERREALEVSDETPDESSDTAASELELIAEADAADADPDMDAGDAVRLRAVTKTFGSTVAVDDIDLRIPAGTFYGIVGPNGAGKTTTLSMIAGLLRPDRGEIRIGGIDLARDTRRAKQRMGILPDRLRTFDRLTGRQLLHYYGVLRGLRSSVVESRSAELARAFDLTDALARPVSDYSAGMTKKIMLAGAMIHSPRVLVLDEPFESVDPVSSAVVLDILSAYVAHGGTVILSSHGMELVERVCTRLAVIVGGRVLAEGTIDEVRGDRTLEQRFIELVGGADEAEGLEWLHTFSD